jgi:hypothetical protein
MKRSLFLVFCLLAPFCSALPLHAQSLSARWEVLATNGIVQGKALVKFRVSGPGTITINYRVDPTCTCGFAGWGYFQVQHRPVGTPGDEGWDGDPTHYGPYRPWVGDSSTLTSITAPEGQTWAWTETMVGADSAAKFEYRIVATPKYTAGAYHTTPHQVFTVQVGASSSVLSGSVVGGSAIGGTGPSGNVEDCVNNTTWAMTANGARAGNWQFLSNGTVLGIDPAGRQVWAGQWRKLGHYEYVYEFDYMGQHVVQYVRFVDSHGGGAADQLLGYSDAAMRNLNRQGTRAR